MYRVHRVRRVRRSLLRLAAPTCRGGQLRRSPSRRDSVGRADARRPGGEHGGARLTHSNFFEVVV